jgi:NAD+ kinase
MKISFHASQKLRAQKALAELKEVYTHVPPEEADVIVVLGGDGSMLRALHQFNDYQAPIFGMNLGSLGFLLNDYRLKGLQKRIEKAESFVINPLLMEVTDKNGKKHKKLAYNEVSLIRETHASAKIRVHVNGKVRIDELICDGVLVSTPVGSTAYNSSAGGSILSLDANVLPITPISAFRPRNWPGALVNQDCEITFEIIKPNERPVSATADAMEVRDIRSVTIKRAVKVTKTLMFDPDNALQERIFREQFGGGDAD